MSARPAAFRRPLLAGSTALLTLTAALSGMLTPGPARADSAPLTPADPVTPTTVSADALPTVQINGVAWAQVVVGNTVYVAGKFSSARPAGVRAGTQETPRSNLLAYDVRTGELITSFAPTLNGQALSLAASPDGARIYVGGDFTQADGQARSRVAAYSVATGQLVADFRPAVQGQVRAIAATGTTVYLGGTLSAVGGTARNRLAAVTAATGALLPWAPQPGVGPTTGNTLPNNPQQNAATTNDVMGIVVAGPNGQVVVAGKFDSLNGTKATGIGALDGVTGSTRPFAVNSLITNQGVNSAVYSLSTDGTTVFGTAYDYYGPGDLEGTFAASADGGTVRWFADCRGDTYSSFPVNGAVYTASHAHDCRNIGSFAETNPISYHHANAFSVAAAGVNTTALNWNGGKLAGQPAPAHLAWHPTFEAGSYTGQWQAGWSVAGNKDYVVFGGEFPYVNDRAQQGLVRFAASTIAPNKVGPRAIGAFALTGTAIPGGMRLSWPAVYDPDNEYLTYSVYRDDAATQPVCTTTQPSRWWKLPAYGCADTGATAGSHRYLVTASDAFGNKVDSTWLTVNVPASSAGSGHVYGQAVVADGAVDHWRLGETSGSTAYDRLSSRNMSVGRLVSKGADGAISGDTDKAYRFTGNMLSGLATQTAVAAPQTFTVEAWFQTTSKAGGVIAGFGNAKSGSSRTADRQVFMDASGKVHFGVNDGAAREVHGTTAYNDGTWHHVAATLSGTGMSLYVDGKPVATNATVKKAQQYDGYWRVGGDNNVGSGADWFTGQIDEVAVYSSALSAAQVAAHQQAGTTGKAPNAAPTASFTATVTGSALAVDGSGSRDAEGPLVSYGWDFGDGATGTGATASHTYAEPGSYTVTLTVTDAAGATAATTRAVTVDAPPPAPPAPPVPVTVASDAFGREVAGGFGTADAGGTWTIIGDAANASVTAGSGRLIAAPGGSIYARLPVSARDVTVQADLVLEQAPTGGGTFVSLGSRNVGGSRYNVRAWFAANGTVTLSLVSVLDWAETGLGSVTLPGTYTPGTALTVRFEVAGSGPAALRAKVWAAGGQEPAAWQVSATDGSAALQRSGGLQVEIYRSKSATGPEPVRIDNLHVQVPGTAD